MSADPGGAAAEPAPRLSLTKALKPQPLVEDEVVLPPVPVASADPPEVSRGRRAVAAAANVRDQTIRRFVGLLVPLIRATRYPLLLVVLAVGVPAVAVILVALLRLGPDDPFWLLLGTVGLVLAAW